MTAKAISQTPVPDLAARLFSLFGHRAFRLRQEDVIRAILAGRDTFTLMPTGGGKSLCYQLPATILPGVCIVVSPLISLMKDQVDAATATGIAAAAFNSASAAGERGRVRAALSAGTLDLLYIAPERLRLPEFLAFLKTVPIAFFAIDEAHCISEWGHDFRPDYLALSELKREFPGVAVSAFTATATSRVEQDIITRLGLADPLCTKASFDRANLFYQVTPKENLDAQLLAFIKEHRDEPGIIYRTTRKDVEKTAAFLRSKGIDARAYHAGLADGARAAVQESFRRDETPLIVATIAFGMGIDKPNVRYVVHGDLPKNLESYYQETGRAGRDGESARCLLFYGRKDIAQLLRFAEGIEDERAREAAISQVYRMLDFTQKEACRRKTLLAYFGEELPTDNCGSCDICTGEVEREDALVAAQKLLSAMVRTGCRFGATHCINVVMGKETPRIRDLGHTELPTFGVGRDKDNAYWHRVMDAIMAQGLAATPDPAFPVPAVTAAGWEVLRGKQPFSIVRLAQSRTATPRVRKADAEASPLFQALREERALMARESNLPPYAVFANVSLREMARLMPSTPASLLAVPGIGTHRLAAYGERVLACIAAYRDAHPEEAERADALAAQEGPIPNISPAGDVPRPPEDGISKTCRETEKLLDLGLSVEATAEERGQTVSTILGHMEKLAAAGKIFSAKNLMDADRLNALHDLFTELGNHLLTPVVERSRLHPVFAPDGATYPEARLARILTSQKSPVNTTHGKG